jgi:hypothetical protein
MAKLRIGLETVSLPMSEIDDGRALSLIRRVSTEGGLTMENETPNTFHARKDNRGTVLITLCSILQLARAGLTTSSRPLPHGPPARSHCLPRSFAASVGLLPAMTTEAIV